MEGEQNKNEEEVTPNTAALKVNLHCDDRASKIVGCLRGFEGSFFHGAWLTFFFFVTELVLKSPVKAFQVANIVAFVIGPSGINWLLFSFLHKEGLPRSVAF